MFREKMMTGRKEMATEHSQTSFQKSVPWYICHYQGTIVHACILLLI